MIITNSYNLNIKMFMNETWYLALVTLLLRIHSVHSMSVIK